MEYTDPKDGRKKIVELRSLNSTHVQIKNLQSMHEESLPPTGARRRMELEYQDSMGSPARQRTTHVRPGADTTIA